MKCRNIYLVMASLSMLMASNFAYAHCTNLHPHHCRPLANSGTVANSNNSSNRGELTLPASFILNEIKRSLNGTKIRLNNYGKQKPNKSWYKGGDSYIKIPGLRRISLGDIQAINKIPFRYYINDINLRSFNLSVDRNRFLIRFNFEDRGPEIKGRCASKNFFANQLCIKGSDRSAPDIQINRAVASVYLTPAVRNGSVSYGSVSADFNANIRVGKTCEKLGCNKVIDYKSRIKKTIRTKLAQALNNNSIRNKIASSIKSNLRKFKVDRVTHAAIQGNSIKIKFIFKR